MGNPEVSRTPVAGCPASSRNLTTTSSLSSAFLTLVIWICAEFVVNSENVLPSGPGCGAAVKASSGWLSRAASQDVLPCRQSPAWPAAA